MNHFELLRFLILDDGPAAPSYSAGITPPAGTIWTIIPVTFTATTNVPAPVYTWSVGPGATIVSGQGTASAVIRFDSAGARSVSLAVTGGGSAAANWAGTVEPFVPTLIPNMALWVDANDAASITLDVPGNISGIADKSGNSRNFVQGLTNPRPGYIASVLNGKPVIRSDGIDDTIKTAAQPAAAWYGSGTQQITWTYLIAYINTGRWSLQLIRSVGDSQNRMILDRQPSGVGVSDFQFTAGSTGAMITSAPYLSPITAWAIETVRWTNGGTPTMRRTTTAGTNTFTAAGPLTGTMADNQYAEIGSGAILPANFNLAEWMIYSRNLSDAEVSQNEAFLLAKWGPI